LRELPPLVVALGRVGFAAIALHLWILARGARMPTDRRLWGQFAVMGLINNVIPFALILSAQTHIASGLASILNGTTPLFTVIFAYFLADGALDLRRIAGVALGIAGVALTIGFDALGGLGRDVVAELAVLAAAASYALAGLYGRRFRPLGPVIPACGQVTASTLCLAPVALIADRPWLLPIPHATTILAVLGLALFATALAYAIYFRLLATAGPANLLLVTLLMPVSALALGFLFLDEPLKPSNLAGMALVFAGLAVIDGRLLDKLRPRRASLRSAAGRSNHDAAA
jgi:drug/metabolite transporter (DMT)-like permease